MQTYCVDFIIIGAGTAANVLARLLSDDKKTSVVALEAGANDSKNPVIRDSQFVEIEFGLEENFYPAFFWQQDAMPNGSLLSCVNTTQNECLPVHCSAVANPLIAKEAEQEVKSGIYSTGYLLGGGSSINGQQWVRGTDAYWRQVSKIAGPLWNYKSVQKRYKKIERYLGIDPDPSRGLSGYVSIRQAPVVPTQTDIDFAKAVSKATGVPQILDYNNPSTPIGSFTRWQLTQKADGSRESSDTAFLPSEVMHMNGNGRKGRKLKIFFNTRVLNIIVRDGRAIGIRAYNGGSGTLMEIYAAKQIILSAGIYSAELLQKSGIGPKSLLNCLDIPLSFRNDEVGANLHNHLILPITFSGPTTTNIADPLALYSGGAFLPALSGDFERRGYQLIGAVPQDGVFMILLISLQPISSGVVRIQSKNPLTVSLVDNNYLGSPLDVTSYMQAVRTYIAPIAEQLRNDGYNLISPTLEQITDDEQLAVYVKANVDHTHHWTGTNSISKVVDSKCKVYGVKGLRVADCSALPIQPDGNTQAPAYLVGWTVAELLKNKYL